MPFLSDGTVPADMEGGGAGGDEKCEITDKSISNMATTTAVEMKDDTMTRPRIVKEPVQNSKSEKKSETNDEIKTNKPSVRKNAWKDPFHATLPSKTQIHRHPIQGRSYCSLAYHCFHPYDRSCEELEFGIQMSSRHRLSRSHHLP